MRCEGYRALIEEAAGRGSERGGALGAHLSTCAACRQFGREREALVGLLAGLGRVNAPDDFEFRLRARIARQRVAERSLLRRLRLAPGLAAAAVAACLLAAAALYLRTQPGAPGQVAATASPVLTSAADAAQLSSGEVLQVSVEALPADDKAVGQADKSRAGAAVVETAARRNNVRARRAAREGNFGVRVAPVFDGSGRQLASHSATQAVALRTSPETLRVVLRDERGEAYVLPMRTVSFGAQGPVARNARAARASHKDRGGVW